VKGVRGFLGFANFYRQFIKGFSGIARHLTILTTKELAKLPFHLPEEALKAFETLKFAFISAPVLLQFDADRETIVETDSSGWCTGATLSQVDEKGDLRPCAYFSRKLNPAESNYNIYNKELLAIIRVLKE
jgi:RNase H-like domain found in reverse transcriptase